MLGTSLLWRSTVAFTYLKVKSTKCLCLLPVVLVLLLWSWSCKQRSWSCYFGLGLCYFGLKNLVLFTSLVSTRSVWVRPSHSQISNRNALDAAKFYRIGNYFGRPRKGVKSLERAQMKQKRHVTTLYNSTPECTCERRPKHLA